MRESEVRTGIRVRLAAAIAAFALPFVFPAASGAEPAAAEAAVAAPTSADQPAADEAAVEDTSPAPARAPEVTNALAELEKSFYHAFGLILSGKFGESSQLLATLRADASARGIRNLPKFALDLIDRAQTVAEANQPEEVLFLIGQATQLAPDEPRVWFGAATFSGIVGIMTAFGYWWKGLMLLPASPILSGGVGAGLLLAALTAATLGLLVVSLLMVMRNIDALFERVSRLLPFKHRALGGSLVLVVALVLPLLAGILPAIAVWSLLVAAADRTMRFAAFLCSALILCWALALPTITTVLLAARTPALIELERLQHSSFTPGAESSLKEAIKIRPNSAALLFGLGEIAWFNGSVAAASKLFDAARDVVGFDHDLRNAIDISRGAVLAAQGKNKEARELLVAAEVRGARGEQLYHNLALVSLAALDTVAAEQYATRARAYHVNDGIAEMSEEAERARGPMVATLPRDSVGQALFWHPGTMLDRERERRSAELGHAMMIFGSPQAHGILAFVTFGLAVLGSRSRKGRRQSPSRPTRSRIWAIFPGGRLVMGGAPRAGLLTMVAVFLCALLLVEAPVRVPGLSVIEAPRHYPLMVLMLILFVTGLRAPSIAGAAGESDDGWQGGDE